VVIDDLKMILQHSEKEGKVMGGLIGGEPRGGRRSLRGRNGDDT
jgi:hypothetical protein